MLKRPAFAKYHIKSIIESQNVAKSQLAILCQENRHMQIETAGERGCMSVHGLPF